MNILEVQNLCKTYALGCFCKSHNEFLGYSMEYSYLSACIDNWYCVIYFFSCGTKPRKTFT